MAKAFLLLCQRAAPWFLWHWACKDGQSLLNIPLPGAAFKTLQVRLAAPPAVLYTFIPFFAVLACLLLKTESYYVVKLCRLSLNLHVPF